MLPRLPHLSPGKGPASAPGRKGRRGEPCFETARSLPCALHAPVGLLSGVMGTVHTDLPGLGAFDYIIIGAGSAGCLLANRLSADPKTKVLVLEAGGRDSWIWFHIPVGYLFAIGNRRADWMFETLAEPGLNGRALAYPRGKVLGGSSAINAMITMRGQKADYDHWRQLGLPGWGSEDVWPLFRALEDHFMGPGEHHGAGGEWRVEAPRVAWDILGAVAEAGEEMGIARVDDFNTGDNEGSGPFHVNQKRGVRWSAARGFLKPVIGRPNLRVETGVLVDRLILDGRTVRGVVFRQNGAWKQAQAGGEVILSAGSIGSVQVLQRSGIGPGDVLKDAGVDVAHDLPGVGANLQDHLQQRAIYRVSGAKTLNETYHSLTGKALMALQYALFRRGPLTMAPSQLGIFTRSDASQTRAGQYRVSCPAALPRPVRRPAAPVSCDHGQRLQPATDLARPCRDCLA